MKQTALQNPQPHIREGSPTFHLRGENLEYYRNIEYLKEVTRQANALLDRSNAKYENILDDQTLGYKVRARSISDEAKSTSPDMEGKCRKCGLAHGASTFCIVEKIMDNEKQIEEERKSKGSWKSLALTSIDSKSLKQQLEEAEAHAAKQTSATNFWENMNVNILDNMTPGQVLDTHDMLSARYGQNAGRQFLLVKSKAHPADEGKIEEWMTNPNDCPKRIPELSKKPLIHYEDMLKHCQEPEPAKLDCWCPEISEEVKQKMVTLVDLVPPCEALPLESHNKNWRAVFRHKPKKEEGPSTKGSLHEEIQSENSGEIEECKCPSQQCVCGTENICTTAKVEKRCSINMITDEEDNDNNYLLTMRKKIWSQRATAVSRRTMQFSKPNITPVVQPRSRTDEFLEKAKVEQYKSLHKCLNEQLKNAKYDKKELKDNVWKIADVTAPFTAINSRQWDHWLENMKEQEEIEEQDEVDSMPSDIHTDEETKSDLSHSTGVDYKPDRIHPTRIPYGDDVYDLIDKLYDKITTKFEKSIEKNSFKTSRLSYRPTFAFLYRKMTLLSHQNELFHNIMHLARFSMYTKRFTPYSLRKLRKLKRLRDMEKRLKRTQKRREIARGVQLGKKYRKARKSFKYAPESDYIGFKPEERKLLNPNEQDRFAKFNFVGDIRGKAITAKRIHHDYRLIRRMFEDAAQSRREDLMDQGMLDRLYEFQKKKAKLPYAPWTDSDTEDEERFVSGRQVPPREELTLLQKANGRVKSGYRHIQKQKSHENVPHKDFRRIRLTEAEKSISADTLKSIGKLSSIAVTQSVVDKEDALQKCTSSTNVKGEKKKAKDGQNNVKEGKPQSKKYKQMRSSVKSLTNLLPPLKGQKSDVSNEFEETISSLQQELASLLTQPKVGNNIIKKSNERRKNQDSSFTKLPELKTSLKTTLKTNTKRISDESLPHIKQRESLENLKPGGHEKLPRKGLTKKTSMMNLQSQQPKRNEKLPILVEKTKVKKNTSDESLAKNKKKPTMKKEKVKLPSVQKQSACKAWR